MMVQSTDSQEDNGIMSPPALTGYKMLCGACNCKLFPLRLEVRAILAMLGGTG